MASIIVGKRQLVKDILETKPLFGNLEQQLKKLSDEVNEIDKRIGIANFDQERGDYETRSRALKELATLRPEYEQKSEARVKLHKLLETIQNHNKFKQLCHERQIYLSGAPSSTSADIFQQPQFIPENLHFKLVFFCGHTREFDLMDILDVTSQQTLLSGKCEIQLGNVSCGEACKRNNVLVLYLHRVF